jgi:replicative DNA helicase
MIPEDTRVLEAAFLGGLIRHPAELDDLRDEVQPEDLGWAANQDLYRLLLAMRDAREHIDLVTVNAAIGRIPKPCDDPASWLAEVYDAGFSAYAYAPRIVEASLSRGLTFAVRQALGRCENPTGSAEERMNELADGLTALSNRLPGCDSYSVVDSTNLTLAAIDARKRGEQTAGLPTGFAELDTALCGGLPIGELSIVGARPSTGKTSFAAAVIRNVCRRGGCVFFASLEQRHQEINERMLAAEAGVNGQSIRTGAIDDREIRQVGEAARLLRTWKLHVADKSGVRAGRIASSARQAKRKMGGLDLVVVDYIQLIDADNPKATTSDQIGQSTKRLRDLAKQLDVPVLLLSQLNRDGVDRRPRLSDLRGSGDLEQHAGVVLFLHRAGEWHPDDRIEVEIAKQRNGPLATMEFVHHGWCYRWEGPGIPT